MHLLITRPRQQANVTADGLKKLGHECTIEPLLQIETLANTLPDQPYSGLIITSSNAIAALDDLDTHPGLKQLPVLTTGEASAKAAEDSGFETVDHVAGSALDLIDQTADWMRQHGLKGNLLYPCAETTAHDLQELLAARNIASTNWPIYRASPASRFSASTRQMLATGKFDGVLLYSKRTAHTFVQLMIQDEISMKGLRAYVMSRAIADALPEELKDDAQYPKTPNEPELLNLIGP